MKIRQGFVSNSSTASFIIKYKEIFSNNKNPILDKETCKLLEDYGFKKSWASYPHHVHNEDEKIVEDDFYSYTYEVICNEQDDLEWLIKNNIPFIADCHYDQYTLVYEKDSDHVLVLKNMGIYYQMILRHDFGPDILDEKAAKKIPINEFIKNGYYI